MSLQNKIIHHNVSRHIRGLESAAARVPGRTYTPFGDIGLQIMPGESAGNVPDRRFWTNNGAAINASEAYQVLKAREAARIPDAQRLREYVSEIMRTMDLDSRNSVTGRSATSWGVHTYRVEQAGLARSASRRMWYIDGNVTSYWRAHAHITKHLEAQQ